MIIAILLLFSRSVISDSLGPHGLQHARLPKFVQTHVHWIGDANQSSHSLSSPSPLSLNLFQHQGFFPVSQFFSSGGQSTGASASASVIPMNIQHLPVNSFSIIKPLLYLDLIFFFFFYQDSHTSPGKSHRHPGVARNPHVPLSNLRYPRNGAWKTEMNGST